MSQAIHIGTDYERQSEWFECDRCGARQMVSPFIWHDVPVIGEKPTLDVCEHRPHIPPSPSAIEAHNRQQVLLGVALIASGEIERGKAILDASAPREEQHGR